MNTADLLKFLIKHGIGAPRSLAETQAKVYTELRREPQASEREILAAIFVRRADIALSTGSREWSYEMVHTEDWVDSVIKCNPDLLCLTMYLIFCEYPVLRQPPSLEAQLELNRHGVTHEEVVRFVLKVVVEALDRHAPSWRKHYSGVIDLETGEMRPEIAERDTLQQPSQGAKAQACSILFPMVKFEGHTQRVNTVALRPDGQQLLSGGADSTLRLWDVSSGHQIHSFQLPEPVESLNVSPNGRLVVSAAGVSIDLWDIANLRRLLTLRGQSLGIYTVRFHPNGQQIVSCDDETIRFWDLHSLREIRRISYRDDFFSYTALSYDCQFAIVCSDTASVIRYLDLQSGKERDFRGKHVSQITAIAISRTGQQVLTGSLDSTSRLWDVSSGREICCFEEFGKPVGAVAFHQNQRSALTAGDGPDVVVWDLRTRNTVALLDGHRQGVSSVAVSGDPGFAVAGGYDGSIYLWQLE
jgi:hypothetical protein